MNQIVSKAVYLIERHVFKLAILIRVLFYAWMEVQDRFYDSKFTDIDYEIFSHASYSMLRGLSPYVRPTYRYSPFLAWLVTPNITLYHNFGKILFLFCDIFVGLVLKMILSKISKLPKAQNNLLLAFWLLNPLVMMTSARGSFDTLPCLLIALVIWSLMSKRYLLGGIVFGFLVHFRVFPVIYSPILFLFLNRTNSRLSWVLPKARTLVFFFSALLVFVFYFWHYYSLYGRTFVQETYLYHLSRKDHRHNFSIHFLNTYLNYETLGGPIPVLLMAPQLIALLLIAFRFYKNLAVGLFLQTFFFVIMNKVITAQYFEWFMVFLPLVLLDNQLFLVSGKRKWLLFGCIFWQVFEILVNVPAGLFENCLWDSFLAIHVTNCAFYLANLVIIILLMQNQSFENLQKILIMPEEIPKKVKKA